MVSRVNPSHPTTERRARVQIDGRQYVLAPDCDLVELMRQVESAPESDAAMIHIRGGDDTVSVPVTPLSAVVLTVERVLLTQPEHEPPFVHPSDWNV